MLWYAAMPTPDVERVDRVSDDKGASTMKLGLGLTYWGLGFTKHDQLTLAQQAEQAGFDSVWISEGYGSDAVSILAWIAAGTSHIGLGSAIMQIPGRPPTTTAMSAATLDVLSEGRFRLGLGVSGPQVSEGWYGTRFGRQLQRTREYVDIVRKTLAREHVTYDGQIFELPLPDGPGKPLKLTIGPQQERLPILLAALGPNNVALAGEIADGWLPTFFSPEHVDELRKPFEAGAARAGRDASTLPICPLVFTCVDDDIEAARDALRFALTLYVGGMGSREKNVYNDLMVRYGFPDEARLIQDLYLSGRKAEAEAALPSEFIDLVALCGPEDRVREQLEAFARAGVDTLIVSPQVSGAAAHKDQLARIARAGADHLLPVAPSVSPGAPG